MTTHDGSSFCGADDDCADPNPSRGFDRSVDQQAAHFQGPLIIIEANNRQGTKQIEIGERALLLSSSSSSELTIVMMQIVVVVVTVVVARVYHSR